MRAEVMLWTGFIVGVVGCGAVDSPVGAHDAQPDAPSELPVDAASLDAAPRCDPRAPFAKPVPVEGLPDGTWHVGRFSADEQTVFVSGHLAGAAEDDLHTASRSDRSGRFGPLRALTMTSATGKSDLFPTLSHDGRTLVLDSDRGGPRRLWVATRDTTVAEFGMASPVGGIAATSAADTDSDPFLTADGEELWFSSTRSPNLGNIDLWRASRSGTGFANPIAEPALSSSASDGIPVLSADRLTIYFQSSRNEPGSTGGFDIWTSRRSTVRDGFPLPTPVTEVNSASTDWPSWLSADDCRLYLTSSRDGGQKLYVAIRPAI